MKNRPKLPHPNLIFAACEGPFSSIILLEALLISLFFCQISQAGLLANWNFDNQSLADSSGNGKTLLTDHGSAEYLDEGDGKILNASEDSFYYDFGNEAQLNHFTISFWAKTQAGGNNWKNYWALLSSVEQTGTNNDYAGLRFQCIDNAGKIGGVAIYNGGKDQDYAPISNIGGFSIGFNPSWELPRSEYDHFVFTVDNGAAKLYINDTQRWSGNWTNTDKIGIFSLAGCYNAGNGRDMPAYFDNVSVYNRGLTAGEVNSIFQAGSGSTNNFADIYSRELSGTEGKWSENVWKHQLGESGTITENRGWTDFSQVKLNSSNDAVLTIDQDIHTSKTTLTGNVTLSVEERKTAVIRGLEGSSFIKSGAGTLKIEGDENYLADTSKDPAAVAVQLRVTGGILDITGSAKLFNTQSTDYYNASTITIETNGTLRISNFVNYGSSNLKCLASNSNVRILDGGTVEITGGNQSGQNSFEVTSKGGTLLSSVANATVTFEKFVDGSDNVHPILLNGNLTLGGAGDINLLAPISGGGGLIKAGTGKATIASSENTFTGDIVANEGILDISGKTQSNIRILGGTVQVLSGAEVSAQRILICDAAGLNEKTSTLNIQGGTVTITGTQKAENTGANLMIGHWAGNAVLNVTGGTLNVKDAWTLLSWDSSGELNISGTGVANLYGIDIHNSRESTAALNVTDGGTLNVGEAGIFFIPTDDQPTQRDSKTITFGNSTIGAFADWNSSMNITLAGTETGTTFHTTDSVDSATGRTITLEGALSGAGGLNVTGNGTLVLSGNNTYSGHTIVSSGATLQLDGSIANSALKLEENATLRGCGDSVLKSIETAANSRLLFEVDAEGNLHSWNVLDTATLSAGILDFEFEDLDAIADTSLTLLTASQMEHPEQLSELLAEAWQGILDLSILHGMDGRLALVASVSSGNVPEPSTWLLGMLGILGGMWCTRKKWAPGKVC